MAITAERDGKQAQEVIDWLVAARPDVTWPFTAAQIIEAQIERSYVYLWRTRGGMHYEAPAARDWDDTPMAQTVTTVVTAEVLGAFPAFGNVEFGNATHSVTTIRESSQWRGSMAGSD